MSTKFQPHNSVLKFQGLSVIPLKKPGAKKPSDHIFELMTDLPDEKDDELIIKGRLVRGYKAAEVRLRSNAIVELIRKIKNDEPTTLGDIRKGYLDALQNGEFIPGSGKVANKFKTPVKGMIQPVYKPVDDAKAKEMLDKYLDTAISFIQNHFASYNPEQLSSPIEFKPSLVKKGILHVLGGRSKPV